MGGACQRGCQSLDRRRGLAEGSRRRGGVCQMGCQSLAGAGPGGGGQAEGRSLAESRPGQTGWVRLRAGSGRRGGACQWRRVRARLKGGAWRRGQVKGRGLAGDGGRWVDGAGLGWGGASLGRSLEGKRDLPRWTCLRVAIAL